jgi:hypothetical protein
MTGTTDLDYAERVRASLSRYSPDLVRLVAGRLVNPRGQWPTDELIRRIVEALPNTPAIDRRLKALPTDARRLLAIIALGRQRLWSVATLVELQASVGAEPGVTPIVHLLEEGLLYPIPGSNLPITDLNAWVAVALTQRLEVYAPPVITARARGDDWGVPTLPTAAAPLTAHEADGLDWLLRLGAFWQEVRQSPLRLTMNGGLFKRDLQRLQTDPRFQTKIDDWSVELPDGALLWTALAKSEGLVLTQSAELHAGTFPAHWDEALSPALGSLWAQWTRITDWDPVEGATTLDSPAKPFASTHLLLTLLLAHQPAEAWLSLPALAVALQERHPVWNVVALGTVTAWVRQYCLGLAYPNRLVAVAHDADDATLVQLSAFGRALLLGTPEPTQSEFRQTLLVQPNCEVLLYRQGVTPRLIAQLSLFAHWTALGPACQLLLTAEDVYQGLEAGLTFPNILQTLNQRGVRPVPEPVVQLLRTWASKRERIVVYRTATLLEFTTPADLDAALERGTIKHKLTDRIGLAETDHFNDFRGLRVIGNRDYAAPAEPCVEVEADGVTLTIDVSKSDLLLESELRLFAESASSAQPQQKCYRVTPTALTRAKAAGWTVVQLDDWFQRRTGGALPPVVQLFWAGLAQPTFATSTPVVVEVPSEALADGLENWEPTQSLLARRVGPTTLLVDPANRAKLTAVLAQVGIKLGAGPE